MDTAAATSSPASSRYGAFALVFGISFGILYTVCDMAALPLFTYHPGTDRIDFGFVRARPDEGPAMYWYGWIAMSGLGACVLGGLAALLPEKIRDAIPAALAWIVPVVLLPLLIYSLKFYWRWE
jgi:hypothetical protein